MWNSAVETINLVDFKEGKGGLYRHTGSPTGGILRPSAVVDALSKPHKADGRHRTLTSKLEVRIS